MPEERPGRPHQGLRVGPWLSLRRSSADPDAPADRPGPSWSAPTVELRPPWLRRREAHDESAQQDAAGSGGDGQPPAGTGSGPRTPAGVGAADALLPVPGWLRQHAWLFAAGAVAVLVICCSRSLITGPEPIWSSAGPASSTTPATTAPATTVAAATASPPATPTPSAVPSPAPRVTRSTARPARKPSPSRSQPRPAPSPVLLGPDNGWELWFMLRRYCDQAHDMREAQLRSGMSPAEDNWECRDRGGQRRLIDMDAACRHTYGGGAFARFGNRDDALSWRCYRTP